MPSPSRMIRENESTTRKPSPVGAAAGLTAPGASAPAAADPCRPPFGPWPSSPRSLRPSRSRVSSFIHVFPWPPAANEEVPFTESLAARSGGATAVTCHHAQSGVVVRLRLLYLQWDHQNA